MPLFELLVLSQGGTYETYGKNLLLLGEFGSTWVGRS